MAIREQLIVIFLIAFWCLADPNSAAIPEDESDASSDQGDQSGASTASKLARFDEIHDTIFSEVQGSSVNLDLVKIDDLLNEANELNSVLIEEGVDTKKFHFRNNKFIDLQNYMKHLTSDSCQDADIRTIFPWRVDFFKYPSLSANLNDLASSYLLGCMQQYAEGTLERFKKMPIKRLMNLYNLIPRTDYDARYELYLLNKDEADSKITDAVITYLKNNSNINQLTKLTMDQHKALFEKKMNLLMEKTCEPVTGFITPSLKTVFDMLDEIYDIKRDQLKGPIDPRVDLVYMCYGATKLQRSSTYGQYLALLIDGNEIKKTLLASGAPLTPTVVYKLVDQLHMLQQVAGYPQLSVDVFMLKKLGKAERENCNVAGLKGLKMSVESLQNYAALRDYINDSIKRQLKVCIKEFDRKIGWISKIFGGDWTLSKPETSKVLDKVKEVLKAEKSSAKYYDRFEGNLFDKALLAYVKSEPAFTTDINHKTFMNMLRRRFSRKCIPFTGSEYSNLHDELMLLRNFDDNDKSIPKKILNLMGKAQVCDFYMKKFKSNKVYDAFRKGTQIK